MEKEIMKANLIKHGHSYALLKKGKLVAFAHPEDFSNEHTIGKLSLKNCEAIANGYDLDDSVNYFKKGKTYIQQDGVIILAGENATDGIVIKDPLKSRGVGHYSNEWNPKAFCEYSIELLEILSDKKFSEGDVREAIDIARNGSMKEQHNGYGRPTESRFVLDNLPSDKIIQSLQQTEFDVEIVMEPYHDGEFADDGETHIFEPKWRPKLDADGCMILKRIQ